MVYFTPGPYPLQVPYVNGGVFSSRLWRDDDSALIEGHIAHLLRAGQGISGGTDGDTDEGGVDAIYRRLHPD